MASERAHYHTFFLAGVLVAVLATVALAARILELQDVDPFPGAMLDTESAGTSHEPPLAGEEIGPDRLRVVVAPVVSPERSLYLYRGLVDWLGQQVGLIPELLPRSSYAEVNSMVRHHLADVAFVCSYAFVEGERDFGMEALAIPVIGGRTEYFSNIVVRRESDAESLMDLRGKRFASADILSASGWLYPKSWLARQHEDPSSFFGEHLFVGGHDRSIQAVVEGYVDGAAVDSLVLDQLMAQRPELASQLKVIQRSPPFGMPPIVVSPDLAGDLKAHLLAAFLSMHESASGKRALKPLGIDRFVRADPAIYDNVRKLVDDFDGG